MLKGETPKAGRKTEMTELKVKRWFAEKKWFELMNRYHADVNFDLSNELGDFAIIRGEQTDESEKAVKMEVSSVSGKMWTIWIPKSCIA